MSTTERAPVQAGDNLYIFQIFSTDEVEIATYSVLKVTAKQARIVRVLDDGTVSTYVRRMDLDLINRMCPPWSFGSAAGIHTSAERAREAFITYTNSQITKNFATVERDRARVKLATNYAMEGAGHGHAS